MLDCSMVWPAEGKEQRPVGFWQWPRGVQITVLSTVVFVLFGWQVRNEIVAAQRRVGMALEEVEGKLKISGVAGNSPAQQAGLRSGDRLLQVAGKNVLTVQDYDEIAHSFHRGEKVGFLVEREGQVLPLSLSPGRSPNVRSLAFNGGGAALYLLVAILALSAPAHDPRRQPLVLFSEAVALELALPEFPFGPQILEQAQVVLFFLLTGWQLSLELKLVSLIPRRALWLVGRSRLAQVFGWLGLGIGVVLSLVNLFFSSTPAPPGRIQTWSSFLLDFFVLPLWAVAVIWLLSLQMRQASTPLARQQTLLVLLGIFPWAGFVLVSTVLQLTGIETPLWFDYVQTLSLFAFPLAVFLAVFRYQFLNLEVLVRRSLVYTALTGSLVLVFYILVGAGSALVSEWVGGGASVVVVSGATLVLGLLFSPLRAFLQRVISERFFPERYAQRQQLVQLAAELPAFGKVQPMAKYLVEKVAGIFGCRSVTLLLYDPTSKLLVATASTGLRPELEVDSAFLLASSDPAVMMLAQGGTPCPASELTAVSGAMAQRVAFFQANWVIPVLAPRGLVGLLLLGSDEETFGVEKLELLSLLAHHVGTVLENARLFEAATMDGLTGLLRRETVLEYLEREWQRAQRYGRPLAVGMADVDFFKTINDLYGHLAGDAVLKSVATSLVKGLRSSDFVGRYGGEEFLLIFPETDAVGAQRVAEKLRKKVEEAVVRLDQVQQLKVTVSIGVAAYVPGAEHAPTDVMKLVRMADERLFWAKENGRNRVEM